MSRRLLLDLAVVLAVCAFFFFYGLGSFGLVGADEPRYAQVAREMLARHDWVTPVLNGSHWFEKPILYYWGAMASFRIFGVSDWAARVPVALMASVLVFFVYFHSRRFRPGSEMDAALITASCAAVIGFARGASTDMPLTAAFTISMLAWWSWFETNDRRWLALYYAAAAIGMLAKGPVSPALAGLVVAVFALVRGEPKRILRTLWIPGIVLFLVIAMPWYVLVQVRNPDFFRVFILEHNLARFGTNLYRHQQPFWYYVPVLIAGVLPWLAIVAAGAWHAMRNWRVNRSAAPERAFSFFLVIWAAVFFVFFSISQSKLPGYVLPAVPALALLAVEFIRSVARDEAWLGRPLLAVHALLSGAVLSAVTLAPYFMARKVPQLAEQFAPRMNTLVAVATFAGLAVAVGIFLAVRSQGVRVLRYATFVPVVLSIAFIIRGVSPYIEATQSSRPVAAELDKTPVRQVAIFGASRVVEYGLGFYRNQPIAGYERGEIPAGEHLVVAGQGSLAELQKQVPGRRVTFIGNYAPQKLDYFWVSAHQP